MNVGRPGGVLGRPALRMRHDPSPSREAWPLTANPPVPRTSRQDQRILSTKTITAGPAVRATRARHRHPAASVAGPASACVALLNNPYGLSLREVRAEIRRCVDRGWQLWEVHLRFAPERKDGTAQ